MAVRGGTGVGAEATELQRSKDRSLGSYFHDVGKSFANRPGKGATVVPLLNAGSGHKTGQFGEVRKWKLSSECWQWARQLLYRDTRRVGNNMDR